MANQPVARDTIDLASVKTVNDAAMYSKAIIDDMEEVADQAHTSLTGILEDALEAHTWAGEAKESAENASEYAARALGNLSTVQSVTETLNWITAHGTMTLTTDTALDPTHVYFVRDNDGDYEVGNYHYSVVTEPKLEDISTYYVLSIDESLNNYVGTHLAVTSEGLWLLPDAGGNKVLIATGGQGHTYEEAGTYLIDSSNTTIAKFTESSAVVGKQGSGKGWTTITSTGMSVIREYMGQNRPVAKLGFDYGNSPSGGSDYAPYATFGVRIASADWQLGNYSVAEGLEVMASGGCSHAEGAHTQAGGHQSHAEGSFSVAGGGISHAEGFFTKAKERCSHAQNEKTVAGKRAQTVLGTCNLEDTSNTTTHPSGNTEFGTYAVIVGNGTFTNSPNTSGDTPSNALTIDWQGNVDIASGAKYKINGTDLSASDVGAVPTTRKVNNKTLSSDITLNASDVSALPISGGTITGDLTVNGDTTLEGVTYLGLDVDSSASKTTPATSGEDKDLFNAIRDLGWYDDVIS